MRIRELNEDGSFSEFKKIDPNSKTNEEIIDDLKAENATLNERLAQTNADAVGFQEFIFASFPELA